MSEWTKSQEAELAREYARIGFRAGERWPYPQDPEQSPAEFLAFLSSIPDAAGLQGYLAALDQRSRGKGSCSG